MIKNAAGIGLFISKTMCVVLVLVLGASLFAAGAFADFGCGEKCSCLRSPMDMHHSKAGLIPFSAGFCNGDPMIPCDLESGQTYILPEFIPGSIGASVTYTLGAADMTADSPTGSHDFRGDAAYQLVRVVSLSAPIYLQNVSLLI